MSSSRNKRKRPDSDTPVALSSEAISSRRRTREARTGAEPNYLAATEEKNEGGIDSNTGISVSNTNNIGESSATGSAEGGNVPQHTQVALDESRAGIPKEEIIPCSDRPDGTKKEESLLENKNSAISPPTNDLNQEITKDGILPSTGNRESTAATMRRPSPRETKLSSMISHRKLLVDRVRRGRSAARQRISDDSGKELTEGESSKGDTAAPSTVSLSDKARDEAELMAFKKLSKSALQAAKKQRTESEAEQDKRPSVTLRKGASVGKKMNAALSSLHPGGTGASVPVENPRISQPQPATIVPNDKAAVPLSQPIAATFQRPAQLASGKPPVQQITIQTGKKIRTTAQSLQQPSQPALRAVPVDVASALRASQKKSSKSFLPTNATKGISSSSISASASVPIHSGLSAPGLPSNRLANTAIVCPHAVALREKRNSIRSKLVGHLRDRQERFQNNEDDRDSALLPNYKSQSANESKVFSSLIAHAKKSALPPTCLPRRRKTQWDSVLEEMKWMANDFIEERKWKVSAARTLGSAVQICKSSSVRSNSRKSSTTAKAQYTSNRSKCVDIYDSKLLKSSGNNSVSSDEEKTRLLAPFSKPTVSELALAKRAAKIVSHMTLEIVNATFQGCALSKSDPIHSNSLKRHMLHRKETGTGTKGVQELSPDNIKTEKICESDRTKESLARDPVGDESKSKASSFRRISHTIDSLLEKPVKSPRKLSKRKAGSGTKADGYELSLTTWQLDTIESVENKWGNAESPGAVIAGPRASGKTIAVCSLLWKQRSNGAQLLACSPFRVMKWVHELNRFKDLKVKAWGLACGISSPFPPSDEYAAFSENQVYVCELSALQDFCKDDFDQFYTLVVDCRYPRGFYGSRLPSKFDGRASDGLIPCEHIPCELAREAWWEHLVESLSKTSLKRMIIENPGPSTFLSKTIEKTEMQRVELFALRAAFILGPQIFASESSSVKKRILTWCRRKTKELKESTTNKMKVVQDFLIDLLRPFYCETNDARLLENVSYSEGKRLESEIRHCALSPSERLEYERCCKALRGVLSVDISNPKECCAASDAMMILRRQSIHSKMNSIFLTKRLQSRLESYPFPGSSDLNSLNKALTVDSRVLSRKVMDSASQADFELAMTILQGSPKLRELLSILRNECDYDFQEAAALQPFLSEGKVRRAKHGNDRHGSKSPKKVVVLAALPEVQILISALLNSTGIRHELLLRPSRFFNPSQGDKTVHLSSKQANASILAWIECQQALSRFNSSAKSQNTVMSHLLIASPDAIAGDHGGIGIDMADVVVLVDEDWSGQGEVIMRSLVAGLVQPNLRATDRRCQILRLVCEGTCEDLFLSEDFNECSKANGQYSTSWSWPFDSYGRFATFAGTSWKADLDLLSPERNEEDFFSFPAINVFRWRNNDLSQVLAIEEGLPSLLSTGSSMSFLPKAEDHVSTDSQIDNKAEAELLLSLMNTEKAARGLCNEGSIFNSNPSFLNGGALTRQDVSAMPIRVYLEHFGKSTALQHATGIDGRPLSASSTDAGTKESSDTSNMVENCDLFVDVLQSSGWNVDPLQQAASVLFYGFERKDLEQSTMQEVEKGGKNGKGILRNESGREKPVLLAPSPALSSSDVFFRRVNRYVNAFASFRDSSVRDGKQGTEAIVYFPPIFPGLLQCSIQAKRDIESLRSRMSRSNASLTLTDAAKRPAATFDDRDAKRLKLLDTAPDLMELISLDPSAHADPPDDLISEDGASSTAAAVVLVDLDEDFGLVGVGAVPLPKDSALAATMAVMDVSSCAADPDRLYLLNEVSDPSLPCDSEELEIHRNARSKGISLNSVVLFVRRKWPRQFVSLPGAAQSLTKPAVNVGDSTWSGTPTSHPSGVPIPGSGNGVIRDINGSAQGSKKLKKKMPAPTTTNSSSFLSRVPGDQLAGMHGSMNIQMMKAKEMYRNKVLSFMSPRQKAKGLSLFESPAYCVATFRFRNRLNDRIPGRNWAILAAAKLGPGVPMEFAKDASNFVPWVEPKPIAWTSIVKRLKTKESLPGDDAKALAESQVSSLRESLSAPYRVDLGPFQSGFLSSLTGMTVVSQPRSRNGVSLPMGVKVQMSSKDHQIIEWNDEKDSQLQGVVERFGTNWVLAAQVMSGLDCVSDARFESDGSIDSRSPRDCRERWQALVNAGEKGVDKETDEDRAATNPVRVCANLFSQVVDKTSTGITSRPSCFLLPSAVLEKRGYVESSNEVQRDILLGKPDEVQIEGKSSSQNRSEATHSVNKSLDSSRPKRKRVFNSMVSAKAKKQSIPLTIPGVAAGSQPSFVASHPSHTQSVQTSVAAGWTNGRTEMWPLQFLDVAEKYRASTAVATTPAAAPVSSPSVSAASSRAASGTRSHQGVPSGSGGSSSRAPKVVPTQQYTSPPSRKSPPSSQGASPHRVPVVTTQPMPHLHYHHPHHHHPRMPPSPASQTPIGPRSASMPQYAAHTPVAHTQQLSPNSAPRPSTSTSTGKPASSKKPPNSSPNAQTK